MPDRPNPLSVSAVRPVRLASSDEEERRVVHTIVQDGLKWDDARTDWIDNQKALTKLRYGIREPKDFPWKGASNLAIPFIDATIRKHKPLLMRLVVEPEPIVEFVGEDPEAEAAERKAEEVYSWLFKTAMDALEPLAYLLDYTEHRGRGYIQVGWDYRRELECRSVHVADVFPDGVPADPAAISQRLVEEYDLDPSDTRVTSRLQEAAERIAAGEQFVKLAFTRVVADRPAIWDRDPIQVILPPRTTDVGNAEMVIIQHVLSLRRLQQMEADGFFERGSIARIVNDMRRGRQARGDEGDAFLSKGLEMERRLQDQRDRIWGQEDEGNILVWEVFHWHDLDGDGLLDRAHSWIHPRSRTKLVARPYLYPFHEWPLVAFDFEKTNRRLYSPRGITEMLSGLQREINAQHNARVDGMTLRNAPVYQMQLLAGFKARNFRVIPGTVLQLPAGARLEPLIQDRGPFPEQFQEENYLRNVGEQYIGTFDPALASASGSGARTATEVQAVLQQSGSTASFDAILFQLAMRRVHTMVWQLFLDLGPKEVFIKVLGDDPQAGAIPRGMIIQKSEIAKKFTLIPTGTIANTNRALELAHAREALQIYAQDVTGYINHFELFRWHLNTLSYRNARRILNSPEQASHLQTLRQAAAELQQNPALQAQLQGLVSQVPPEEQETNEVRFASRNTATEFQ